MRSIPEERRVRDRATASARTAMAPNPYSPVVAPTPAASRRPYGRHCKRRWATRVLTDRDAYPCCLTSTTLIARVQRHHANCTPTSLRATTRRPVPRPTKAPAP